MILAIDTGTTETGYCIIDENLNPDDFGKIKNGEMLRLVKHFCKAYANPVVVIEQFECYGMPIGETTIDSITWNGRYIQAVEDNDVEWHYVKRKEEKMTLCGSMKAKDANIRQALIDLFGDPGTKKNPGKLYGIKKDAWSALAIAVTYLRRE